MKLFAALLLSNQKANFCPSPDLYITEKIKQREDEEQVICLMISYYSRYNSFCMA